MAQLSLSWFPFFITGDWSLTNLADYFLGNQVNNNSNLVENLSEEVESLLSSGEHRSSQEAEVSSGYSDTDNNQDWPEDFYDEERDLTQDQLNYKARKTLIANANALTSDFPAPYRCVSPNAEAFSSTISTANYSCPVDSNQLNLSLRGLEEGQALRVLDESQALNVDLENTGSKVLTCSLAIGVTIILVSLVAFILYSGIADTQSLSPVEI